MTKFDQCQKSPEASERRSNERRKTRTVIKTNTRSIDRRFEDEEVARPNFLLGARLLFHFGSCVNGGKKREEKKRLKAMAIKKDGVHKER